MRYQKWDSSALSPLDILHDIRNGLVENFQNGTSQNVFCLSFIFCHLFPNGDEKPISHPFWLDTSGELGISESERVDISWNDISWKNLRPPKQALRDKTRV